MEGDEGVAQDELEMEQKVEKSGGKKSKVANKAREVPKPGVCYLSRIPPRLKPLKLRHLLSQFGEVLRVYLVPEDPYARLRRKRAGGNSGKNFTEGWVEFAKKSDAKRIAAMLNGEPMGGRKRSSYYYDLWNIKYLRKFKWDNLTEEIAYKNAVREQKLAAEISAAKRERDFYLDRVDQSRAIRAIEERKRKCKETTEDSKDMPTDRIQSPAGAGRIVRHFTQRKSARDPSAEMRPSLAPEVLAEVFRRN